MVRFWNSITSVKICGSAMVGFHPIMPPFQGLVSEEQLLQLIAYVKSLGSAQGPIPPGQPATQTPAGQPSAPPPAAAPKKPGSGN